MSVERVKKIVAVAAGKGGVGKSTIAASLALLSAQRGLKVGILDADLYGPSLPILLPDTTPVQLQNNRLSPAKSGSISTLSISHFGLTDQGTAFRAPVVNMFLEQCVHQVEWGDLDVLYVDFPPGVGDVHLSLLQQLPFDGVVLVTMPNRLSQSDVLKAGDSFQELCVPIVMLIENFAGDGIFGQLSHASLKERYAIPSVASLPFDPPFAALLAEGENPWLRSRLTPAAESLIEIEKQLFPLLEGAHFLQEMESQQTDLMLRYRDGVQGALTWRQVQQLCPCKRCQGNGSVQDTVEVLQVEPVGRYGFRFRFSSGCSQGIYPHTVLRRGLCVDSSH